jgi:recombination protein RecA
LTGALSFARSAKHGYNQRTFVLNFHRQELLLSKPGQKKRLEAAVQAIQGQWGAQALQKGARPGPGSAPVPSLPTGLAALDHILAIGGLPLGHICELIGQPTSGKRTLALHILAHAQERHPCLYVDLARTFDPVYAAACRVNLARLAIAAPVNPSQALDLACDLAAGGRFGLLLFDSTAELRGEALPPYAAAAALRRLRHALLDQPTAFLFLTTPTSGAADSPADYPSGFALPHAAAVRLTVQREHWQRDGNRIAGYSARVAVLRHRWASPGQETTIRVTFNGVHLDSQ